MVPFSTSVSTLRWAIFRAESPQWGNFPWLQTSYRKDQATFHLQNVFVLVWEGWSLGDGDLMKQHREAGVNLGGIHSTPKQLFVNEAHFILKDSQDRGKLQGFSNTEVRVAEIVHTTTLPKGGI